ncbi:hypothetical protein RHECNPAF_122100196 [Rhizobium etli CNPAF512]|nr:hypothetical protein RHECNPAF_122100196 [Rhizobium etli CNPAF512]
MSGCDLVINAQYCVHSKTCYIRGPKPEHKLDATVERRRTGLSEYVNSGTEVISLCNFVIVTSRRRYDYGSGTGETRGQ